MFRFSYKINFDGKRLCEILVPMPREDKVQEEEQRARTAYDLIRMRLERLQENIVSSHFFLARRHINLRRGVLGWKA